MKYTEPNRDDGGWDIDYEDAICNAEAEGFHSIEIYKLLSSINGLQSRKQIALLEYPDLVEGGVDSGNIALMAYAPEMYEALQVVWRSNPEHKCKEMDDHEAGLNCIPCRVVNVIQSIHLAQMQIEDDANEAMGIPLLEGSMATSKESGLTRQTDQNTDAK